MRPERYRAIADQIAHDIRTGALPAGSRLPTHRELARRHGVALATATKVYGELTRTGLVVGERGRGTYVRDLSGFGGLDARRLPTWARVADLSFNQPLAAEQGEGLRQLLRDMAADADPAALLAQHPAGGRSADRAALAEHLMSQGLDVSADDVLVTAGAQHALDTVVSALVAPGQAIAVDALTYPGANLVAETRRVELIGVPVSPGGTDLDALAAVCRTRAVAAIYVMPTLHNPLGFVLDESDRMRLAEIARRHDCVLIEDATYAFLQPDSPPALHTFAPERTCHIGSLSKNLATGLRYGHLVAPRAHRDALIRVLRASSWGTPAVVAAMATRMLGDGTVERMQKLRRDDAHRRQQIAAAELKELGYQANPAAYWGWLPLPDDVRADIVAHRLADNGVLVSTADAFTVPPHAANALRVALAGPPLDELATALRAIWDAVRLI
ncbi:PLP-dependent aminotransferase family protein [Mycolicibacterium goodii]|uniref:GntR family transcriptional regulator n=1 Tax=Mycolicibacterium goodii TaxID=134601 RepID=A0A0K0X100_MYCGD|nr:GntR family transcriptional regulator [Mycolicibacterium goodii]